MCTHNLCFEKKRKKKYRKFYTENLQLKKNLYISWACYVMDDVTSLSDLVQILYIYICKNTHTCNGEGV